MPSSLLKVVANVIVLTAMLARMHDLSTLMRKPLVSSARARNTLTGVRAKALSNTLCHPRSHAWLMTFRTGGVVSNAMACNTLTTFVVTAARYSSACRSARMSCGPRVLDVITSLVL